MRSDLAGREGAGDPGSAHRLGERDPRGLTDPRPRRAAAALAALVALAAAAVAGPWRAAHGNADGNADGDSDGGAFQRLTGGLGGSRVLDAADCGAAFDLRCGAPCREETAPDPGGRRFCRHRGGALR